MSTETPDLDKLSTEQRDKLIEFIRQVDAIIGDGDFDPDDHWEDCELMALSLRAAQILGYENEHLEELFRREFGIAGVTENELDEWLAILFLVDAERRLCCAAGGKN